MELIGLTVEEGIKAIQRKNQNAFSSLYLHDRTQRAQLF